MRQSKILYKPSVWCSIEAPHRRFTMVSKRRSPEENARQEKICELLHMANISSMDDIQNLLKETIAEFMEDGLEAELDEEFGYSRYDYRKKDTDNSRNGHSSKTLRTSFGDVGVSVLCAISKAIKQAICVSSWIVPASHPVLSALPLS